MSTGEAAVRCEKIGAVCCVTLDRPDQINAVNDAIRHGLPAILAEQDRDPETRVILLRGEGARGFCAGADVKEERGGETALEAHRRLSLGPWIEAVAAVRKPVIAALHGACMGGGLELALACDIRVAAPDARFALPEVRLGLIPGGGGTQRLVQVLGLGRALDLLLTGDRIDAAEALRIGLVTRLAPDGASLFDEAMRLCQALAAGSPNALAFVKEAALASGTGAAGYRLERALFGLLLTGEDRVEAAAAFREKRAASFTGR
ncbi:enoyl-CoA hydratase/isomerase family protein [Novosphingobium album (ex Liu et al. 2023)]|uniref:Enoyl-CoA hydratase/isomerase family protein n=1 Tax=Novosphingobium album (ex Liu et al. 2023) TaxID=3031130 RepID=A0ABT5WX90_9SPHN|nr:enoyl-CoA hydratase/isomerase family protein [Novosphingobium album (ex Liu et al. 2023)]MDE8654506.1 enoyl-CoA hydratase/isomerase family protein [Novosphingobium album (ex Liu et al. 2023)]